MQDTQKGMSILWQLYLFIFLLLMQFGVIYVQLNVAQSEGLRGDARGCCGIDLRPSMIKGGLPQPLTKQLNVTKNESRMLK